MTYVEIRYSKDGGNTWSNWRTIPAGETGDFVKQTRARRWGISRQWVFDIRVTDDVPADIIGCSVLIEGYDE